MKVTIKAELLTIKENTYTIYVFKNLDETEDSWYRYVMATKCPNWNYEETLKVGDTGFLEYEIVNAGESYVDSITGQTETYKYSNIYFTNFIKETTKIMNTEYAF